MLAGFEVRLLWSKNTLLGSTVIYMKMVSCPELDRTQCVLRSSVLCPRQCTLSPGLCNPTRSLLFRQNPWFRLIPLFHIQTIGWQRRMLDERCLHLKVVKLSFSFPSTKKICLMIINGIFVTLRLCIASELPRYILYWSGHRVSIRYQICEALPVSLLDLQENKLKVKISTGSRLSCTRSSIYVFFLSVSNIFIQKQHENSWPPPKTTDWRSHISSLIMIDYEHMSSPLLQSTYLTKIYKIQKYQKRQTVDSGNPRMVFVDYL